MPFGQVRNVLQMRAGAVHFGELGDFLVDLIGG
jgi:hypothetical protein